MASEVCIKFHGIRALHAAPSKSNLLYGGNSNCISIEDGEHIFIINSGFGINPLGEELIARSREEKKPVRCHIFLSDFFWENLMGMPFFTPIHFKSSHIHIHSPLEEVEAHPWIEGVCKPDFSPFQGIKSFNSKLYFENPKVAQRIGSWTIQAILTTHLSTPYPVAVWTFEHDSGYKIAFSCNATHQDLERIKLIQRLSHYNVIVQSAIAPVITHPTMEGRWTFAEALQFGREAKAEHIVLTGIHPMLTDQTLIQAEATLSQASGLTSGTHFSVAREWEPIQFALAQPQKKTG